MRPAKKLMIPVLLALMAAASFGAIGGSLGPHPSPYVDDWAIVLGVGDLRNGTVDCDPVIAACLAASGRCIFREGTYLITPNSATSIVLTNLPGAIVEGAGDKTVLQFAAGQAGAAFLLGDDCTVRRLKIKGDDTGSTLGIRHASSRHRGRVEDVTIEDLAVGFQDGNAAVTAVEFSRCRAVSCGVGLRTGVASTNVSYVQCEARDCTTAGWQLQGSPIGVTLLGCRSSGSPVGLSNSSGLRVAVIGCDFADGMSQPAANSGGVYLANGDDGTPLTPASFVGRQIAAFPPMWDNAEPTNGVFVQGQVVLSNNPGTSGLTPIGWVCTTPGTAGVDAVFESLYRGFASTKLTTTWDAPELAAGAQAKTSITTSGLALGDTCTVTHSENLPDGFVMWAQVTSTTNIDVMLVNVGGSTVDVAEGTVTVRVLR